MVETLNAPVLSISKDSSVSLSSTSSTNHVMSSVQPQSPLSLALWTKIQTCCDEIHKLGCAIKVRPLTVQELEQIIFHGIQIVTHAKSLIVEVQGSNGMKEISNSVASNMWDCFALSPVSKPNPLSTSTYSQNGTIPSVNSTLVPSFISCLSKINHNTVIPTSSAGSAPVMIPRPIHFPLPHINHQPPSSTTQVLTPTTTISNTNIAMFVENHSGQNISSSGKQNEGRNSENAVPSPKIESLDAFVSDEEMKNPRKRKRGRRRSKQNLICEKCKTTETPEWRRGPNGPATLCNACGIRWANKTKKEREARLKNSIERLIHATTNEISNVMENKTTLDSVMETQPTNIQFETYMSGVVTNGDTSCTSSPPPSPLTTLADAVRLLEPKFDSLVEKATESVQSQQGLVV